LEDFAFRALAGNQTPDHVTILRFRIRHQQALAGFLVESLRLCAAAGLARLGVVALDGTKVAANAADRANRTLAKLQTEVQQILREAAGTDQAGDRRSLRAWSSGWVTVLPGLCVQGRTDHRAGGPGPGDLPSSVQM
jgi:hypothetical protein